MEHFEQKQRDTEFLEELLIVWESSVRATHDFLEEKDISFLRPYVLDGLRHVPVLFCAADGADVAGSDKSALRPIAFLGMGGADIEMLFVHADFRGRGIGTALMTLALERGAVRVDVNEQNPQALGFYRRFGFDITGRDATDGLGLPFPILHLAK